MAIGEIVRFDALDYVPISVEFVKVLYLGDKVYSTKVVYVPKMLIKENMSEEDKNELKTMILNSLDYDKNEFREIIVPILPEILKKVKPLTMMFPIFSDEI